MPEDRLAPLDRELERLRSLHPGWRIWYVPKFPTGTTWCAQPMPQIHAYSPADLGKEIAAAEAMIPFDRAVQKSVS